jgi:hypothetical protein
MILNVSNENYQMLTGALIHEADGFPHGSPQYEAVTKFRADIMRQSRGQDKRGPALVKELCKKFVGRSEAQFMKGKKRDSAALEFLLGAAAACDAIGDRTGYTCIMSWVAFLLQFHGYKAVAEEAKG